MKTNIYLKHTLDLGIFYHCQGERTEEENFAHVSGKFIKLLLKFGIWQFFHYYFFNFLNKFIYFIYLFLAVLGLRC